MSDPISLLGAILDDPGLDHAQSMAILETAMLEEVDTIAFCIARRGIPADRAYARAAEWAGLAFIDAIPHGLDAPPAPRNLDALARVRTLRLEHEGRIVRFIAPDFLSFLRLRADLAITPARAETLIVVPPAALRRHLSTHAAPDLTVWARQRLFRLWPFASAHLELTLFARIAFVVLLVMLVIAATYAPFSGSLPLAVCAIVIVGAPAALRLIAIGTRTPPTRPDRPEDADLPVYSVLLPLRDEAHMVPQLYRAIAALDYPPEKLDVKFVVEADSPKTVAAVERAIADDARFELVIVPASRPRTKPKAMNYALPLVRGEHVVVFDAEDRPDPDQLWRATQRFAENPHTACIQAELVIDNGNEGFVPALFAGEYAALFGVVLPAFARWGVPVPLGGTSNHFRTDILRQAGAWDAHNVTEDADLGVRLARLGHRVETLHSATREEAPVTVRAWMSQRTRWIKGWMQTFIVHNRQPLRLLKQLGPKGFIFFEVIILGMIVAPLLHVTFFTTAMLRLALGEPHVWSLAYLGLFVFGNTAAFLVNAVGLWRLGHIATIAWQFALPLYWVLLAAATIRALHELLIRPYYWSKTTHRPVREALEPLAHGPGGRRRRAERANSVVSG